MQPFWLERQRDVDGPDFIPGSVIPSGAAPAGSSAGARAGSPAGPQNLTHRTWALVGTVATPDRGVVDPRGLVTPGAGGAPGGGWSLDWWVGADDRWHAPSREAAVRQRLVGESPVVETSMRIPGGDAVQRVYAIHASTDSPFGRPHLIVEVENASAVPFALALAVRPYNPLGYVPVHTISLEGPTGGSDADGERWLMVDGEIGVVLPKAPARVAGTVGADGDVADVVFAGDATATLAGLRCPDGRAQAAVLFPLPHTAVVRVALPLGQTDRPRRRGTGSGSGSGARFPSAVPSAEQVAKGWESQTRRGLRVALPDATWQEAVESGRRWLLAAHGGEDLAGWPERPLDWVEAEPILGALGEQGFHDEVAQVLATLPERQALDGSVMRPGGSAAANGAALVAVARHVELTGDAELAEALVGPVAKSVHWIDKRRRARRAGPVLTGDDLDWSVRGLEAAATMLDGVGQPEVAADARASAAEWRAAPAGRDPRPEPELSGPAVVDPVGRAGLSPMRTLQLARAELSAGDPAALERFAWVLSVAAPTWTWPEVVHPRTGGGSAGDGHHLATGAEVLRFVRHLLVSEQLTGLALCGVYPPAWRGQGLEVHDAPTRFGRLSFAVRWHGARPALLWDLDRAGVAEPVELTCPGLDPTWRSTDVRGEALLSPPADVATADLEPPVAGAAVETDPIGDPAPEPGASFS